MKHQKLIPLFNNPIVVSNVALRVGLGKGNHPSQSGYLRDIVSNSLSLDTARQKTEQILEIFDLIWPTIIEGRQNTKLITRYSLVGGMAKVEGDEYFDINHNSQEATELYSVDNALRIYRDELDTIVGNVESLIDCDSKVITKIVMEYLEISLMSREYRSVAETSFATALHIIHSSGLHFKNGSEAPGNIMRQAFKNIPSRPHINLNIKVKDLMVILNRTYNARPHDVSYATALVPMMQVFANTLIRSMQMDQIVETFGIGSDKTTEDKK